MGIGGTEQVIRQLVTCLPNNKYRNRIVCIDGIIGPIGEALSAEGISVEAMRRKPGLDLGLVMALKRLIRHHNIDIVHCHQYTPFVYGWLATIGRKTKVVFTEHGRFYPDRYRYKAALVNPIMALSSDAVVAISVATREALSKYEFIPKAKVRVIYNGIQALKSSPEKTAEVRYKLGIPQDAYVIGTVARLDPVKNQEMMLNAFAQIIEDIPNSWLLMVGDGPDRKKLEALSSTLGVSDRVIFTGFISLPKDYLASMDLFLLSSHTEGTSMTLLESLSLEIPSVVTNVGGNPEIVTHLETGMLVESDDAAAFADAIKELNSNTNLYETMKINCRIVFKERFSVDKMISQYDDLYGEFC